MKQDSYYAAESQNDTQPKHTTPKHKRKSKKPLAALAVVAVLLIGTYSASFFLHPSIGVFNAENGQAASISLASYFSGDSTQKGLANRTIRQEQAAEEARIAEEEAAAAEAEAEAQRIEESYNAENAGHKGTWHPAWVETIVHPARTEYMSSYPVYVCIYDGYETTDFAEILEYVHGDDNAFVVLTRGGYEVPRSEEWTETIYHPGYWE